jgi:predicted phosphodiesterase
MVHRVRDCGMGVIPIQGQMIVKKCIAPGCERNAQPHRRYCRGHRNYKKQNTPSTVSSIVEPTYDTEWSKFCAWIGIAKARSAPVRSMGSRRIRYGVIGDLHIPFQDRDASTEAILSLAQMNCNVLVIGGDFLDLYSLSRFLQYDRIPIKQEIIEARKYLDWVSREFGKVIICAGNHEQREAKYFATRLTPDEREVYLNKCVLERVSEDMPNVEIVKRTVEGTPMGWLVPIGRDAVVGHAETHSKIPLRPSENLQKWLDLWHNHIGIERPRLVIQGHTHQAGITWIGDRMIVENGCLCRIQGYSLEPRIAYRPQRHAFTLFDQYEGVTDLSTVRQFYPGVGFERCDDRFLNAG